MLLTLKIMLITAKLSMAVMSEGWSGHKHTGSMVASVGMSDIVATAGVGISIVRF